MKSVLDQSRKDGIPKADLFIGRIGGIADTSSKQSINSAKEKLSCTK